MDCNLSSNVIVPTSTNQIKCYNANDVFFACVLTFCLGCVRSCVLVSNCGDWRYRLILLRLRLSTFGFQLEKTNVTEKIVNIPDLKIVCRTESASIFCVTL